MTDANSSGIGGVAVSQRKTSRERNSPKSCTRSATTETTSINQVSSDSKTRTVNIESLKVFANQNLRRDHPLRILLAAERSILKPEEFIAKLECWSCLLREIK